MYSLDIYIMQHCFLYLGGQGVFSLVGPPQNSMPHLIGLNMWNPLKRKGKLRRSCQYLTISNNISQDLERLSKIEQDSAILKLFDDIYIYIYIDIDIDIHTYES